MAINLSHKTGSVYYYSGKWQKTGLWEQILDAFVVKERVRQSREESPSLAAADSQSVKTVNFISLNSGIDGAKKINGRKRHLVVNTLGLSWAISVTAGSVSDSAAGCHVVDGKAKCRVWKRAPLIVATKPVLLTM